ncbi:DUF4330 domain-containing protein [Peptoniphilus raoultii]|uniref:DUF4330 domain-containing protein n=1 Tax=Peptoniphilus raoultii TaxID=1776387 RepID=UPI0008D8ECAC|nr:DUF4330 domain-containing protein [Peptoniphilus raoultii]
MKLIDKKGKIFGLINIIDFFVILLIALAIVFGAKRLSKTPSASNAQTKKGIVYMDIIEVKMATVSKVKEGDPLYDYDKGTYLGKIKSVSYEPYKEEVEYQGKFVLAEVPEKFVVHVEMECDIKETEEFYQVGSEQMRVGYQERVKNKNIATFATIMDVKVEG